MGYTIKSDNEYVDCTQCLCYYCERNKHGCKGCEGCRKQSLITECKRFKEADTSY